MQPSEGTFSPRRSASVLLALTLFLTALVSLPTNPLGYERFAAPKEFVMTLGVFGAALCALFLRLPWSLGRIEKLLGLTTLLGALSWLGSGNHWWGLRAFTVSVSGILAFLVSRFLRERGAARPLGWGVAAAVVLVAGSALSEATGLLPALSLAHRGPGGVLGNRNYCAYFLLLATPASVLVLGRSVDERVRRGATALLLVLVAMTITTSRCRGAWLTAGVMLAMLAVMLRITRRRQIALRLVLAPLLVGTVLALLFARSFGWSGPGALVESASAAFDYATGSGRGRVVQMANTLRMTGKHPLFGVGPGNWSLQYPFVSTLHDDPNWEQSAIQPVTRLPTNDWLGFVSERGVPATLILALVWLLCGRLCLRWRGEDEVPDVIVAIVTATGALVGGIFDSILARPECLLVVAVSVGSAMPLDSETGRISFAGIRLRALIVMTALIGTGAALVGGARCVAILGARSSTSAELTAATRLDPQNYALLTIAALASEDEGDCAAAIALARRALAVLPQLTQASDILIRCQSGSREGARPVRWREARSSRVTAPAPSRRCDENRSGGLRPPLQDVAAATGGQSPHRPHWRPTSSR